MRDDLPTTRWTAHRHGRGRARCGGDTSVAGRARRPRGSPPRGRQAEHIDDAPGGEVTPGEEHVGREHRDVAPFRCSGGCRGSTSDLRGACPPSRCARLCSAVKKLATVTPASPSVAESPLRAPPPGRWIRRARRPRPHRDRHRQATPSWPGPRVSACRRSSVAPTPHPPRRREQVRIGEGTVDTPGSSPELASTPPSTAAEDHTRIAEMQ